MFKPNVQQMATPIRIKHRVSTDVNGAPEISYEDADPAQDFCNWKGKGGSESQQAGKLVVIDTAELTMWYRPDVSERDMVLLNEDEKLAYEVVNVENIEMRNQYMILKVRRAVNA
jgi:hypothetical protein